MLETPVEVGQGGVDLQEAGAVELERGEALRQELRGPAGQARVPVQSRMAGLATWCTSASSSTPTPWRTAWRPSWYARSSASSLALAQ
jgi:hypothetical protein